jgi:hypothetical protein
MRGDDVRRRLGGVSQPSLPAAGVGSPMMTRCEIF